MHIVLWRRLDHEGHDACRYFETADGWTIDGSAVFEHEGTAASLSYRLLCDRGWASRSAHVRGWICGRRFDLGVERDDNDAWRINGEIDPGMAGLKDMDLGFTPASNTNAMKRLNLSEGTEAETVAIWLDADDWTVKLLPQRYRRTGQHRYEYASPQHGYRATLAVDDFGAVKEYPDLWSMLQASEA